MKIFFKMPHKTDSFYKNVIYYFTCISSKYGKLEFDNQEYQYFTRIEEEKYDFNTDTYIPFKNSNEYDKIITHLPVDNTKVNLLFIKGLPINKLNAHVNFDIIYDIKDNITIKNLKKPNDTIISYRKRMRLLSNYKIYFFMMDEIDVRNQLKKFKIYDYTVFNLAKTLYYIRESQDNNLDKCYNKDYEAIQQYKQYMIVRYNQVEKDSDLTNEPIDNANILVNEYLRDYKYAKFNFLKKPVLVLYNNAIMHIKAVEDYTNIELLNMLLDIKNNSNKVYTLKTALYNKIVRRVVKKNFDKFKCFNESIKQEIIREFDKEITVIDPIERKFLIFMIILRFNTGNQQQINILDLPQPTNVYDKAVTRGICQSPEMEEATNIELDLKHMYNIRQDKVKQIYQYVKARYLTDMFIYAELQKLYIYKNYNKFKTVFEVKLPQDIVKHPENFYYKIKAATITVSNKHLTNYKHCSEITKDLYIYYTKICNNKWYAKNFEMNQLIQQTIAYGRWYVMKLKYYDDIDVTIDDIDIVNTSIFFMQEVVNMYRQYYNPFNDLNNDLFNSYKKINYHDVICNMMRAFALMNTNVKDLECTCYLKVSKLKKIINIPQQMENGVIIYNTCIRTLFAAFKRQCRKTPFFDWRVVREYHDFCDDFFDKLIKPALDNYSYSFKKWVNKETVGKQRNLYKVMDKYSSLILDDLNKQYVRVIHRLFCKSEKQAPGGKNRAIAGVDDFIKYITGPIVWPLEQLIEDNVEFYCGHKNAKDYNEKFKKLAEIGDYVIEGDGSGFDQTQYVELKYIDYLIYNYVLMKTDIYHMNDNSTTRKVMIRNIMCTAIKELNAEMFVCNKPKTMFTAEVIGTVFSGSTDTTFANTLRMASYNAFTIKDKISLDYFKGLHKGDDFVEIIPRYTDPEEVLALYDKYWLQDYEVNNTYGLGQVMKKIEVKTFDKIEFCSSIVIPNKDYSYFMYVRDPKRMLRFGFYSRKAVIYNQRQYKQYLLDLYNAFVGSGLQDVPVYWDLALTYKQLANEIEGKPLDTIHAKPKKPFEIPEQLQCLFKEDNGVYKETIYDKYVYDRDYMYSRITHDTTDKVLDHITKQEILDNLRERYEWNSFDIEELRTFLKDPKNNYRLEFSIFDKL